MLPEYCKIECRTASLTPPLNHVMRGALSGFLRAAKNQNLFDGSQMRTEGTLKMEHKPDALIRRYITISGSLIDTRRSFCQKYENDRGCMVTNKWSPKIP